MSTSPRWRPRSAEHLGCKTSQTEAQLACYITRLSGHTSTAQVLGSTHSHPVNSLMGASSFKKQRFWISAAISAPTPAVRPASWTITSRPVFSTLFWTVYTSQGSIVRRSITSIDADRIEFGMCFSSAGGGDRNIEIAASQW